MKFVTLRELYSYCSRGCWGRVRLRACTPPVRESHPGEAGGLSPSRKLIIDSDTGADDSSAIILAASSKDVELLGVTVLVGNVDLEQSAANALMALEMAGSDARVYKGASENASGETIEASSVFGNDGMGEADLVHPKGQAEEKDAVNFILEMVSQYPNEVEIIMLGPATNTAKAIERDPETMKQVKMIWSMGTTGLGPGNASPVAEFNVYADPVAYKTLLTYAQVIFYQQGFTYDVVNNDFA